MNEFMNERTNERTNERSHSPTSSSSVSSQDHKPIPFNMQQSAARHLWNSLPPSLRVPYQSVTSHSSPSSSSDPRLVVHMSHGVFYSRLKTRLLSRSSPQPPVSPTDWFHGMLTSGVWKSLASEVLTNAAD